MINRVVVVGNLTADPELKALPSGTSVCELRIAVNDRIKRGDSWEDYANYFGVTAFGSLADRCSEYLAKGKRIAVDGRLRWSQWQAQDGGNRSKVIILADRIEFLTPRDQPAQERMGGYDGDDIPF